MNEELTPKEMAEKLGINPEKADFELNEKEIQSVSGGAGTYCGEIGVANPDCTKTGPPTGCSEIGAIWGSDCTKSGT
ncbi:MAG: hypothetical protein WCI71_03175 [Bacteroidota bacterium]